MDWEQELLEQCGETPEVIRAAVQRARAAAAQQQGQQQPEPKRQRRIPTPAEFAVAIARAEEEALREAEGGSHHRQQQQRSQASAEASADEDAAATDQDIPYDPFDPTEQDGPYDPYQPTGDSGSETESTDAEEEAAQETARVRKSRCGLMPVTRSDSSAVQQRCMPGTCSWSVTVSHHQATAAAGCMDGMMHAVG
jgi:hypothetical protein